MNSILSISNKFRNDKNSPVIDLVETTNEGRIVRNFYLKYFAG